LAVRLFVGNLSYATTEADLRTYFGTVAPPSQVVLPVDRETGRPRGFAFVEYLDRAHAEQAIQRFNGQAFNGRPLAVSEARAREDRGPGGFSGPRPGGPPGPRPGGGFPPRPSFGGPRFDSGGAAPSSDRSRNFGPDAKPQRGAAAKKGKKGDERPRGPIPVKATRRSFTLDDDDAAAAADEAIADIDNFATSKPEDKEDKEDKDVEDKPDDDEKP
jgi:RNA recognition motif-containing protein